MGKCEKWTIAYRKRNGTTTLLDDTATPFTPIRNTWRYWRADPFLFEKDGKTYLFAELYDRLRLRGVIGYCELTEDGSSEWKIILDEPFHLSYPFIFQEGNEIYMIPESYRAKKILLYRAVRFPDQWERIKEMGEMVAVDSTLADIPGGKLLITYRSTDNGMELIAMDLDADMTGGNVRSISRPGDANVRPAGKFFAWQGQQIRPAQDCTTGYGWALNLMQVTQMDKCSYAEHLLKKIQPQDVTIQGVRNPCGIHTYNFTDQYEVIDCKELEFGVVSKAAGVIERIKRIIHFT